MASSTPTDAQDTTLTEIFSDIEAFFGAADPVALSILLVFLASFVYVFTRPRILGNNKQQIENSLKNIRENVIEVISRENDGKAISEIIDLILKESPKVLLPLKLENTKVKGLGILTIAMGAVVTFYDQITFVPFNKGVWWSFFGIALIYSCLYLWYDVLYWMEVERIRDKYKT